ADPLSFPVTDDVYDILVEGLKAVVEEIFNPELPFSYSPSERRCQYCPAYDICPKRICSKN
ncbi:MAG: hypothetical protein J6Z27_04025, partial [Bacteroidales bacterium]|nr:hypothetical protein [Bacteroidales bacterium]